MAVKPKSNPSSYYSKNTIQAASLCLELLEKTALIRNFNYIFELYLLSAL